MHSQNGIGVNMKHNFRVFAGKYTHTDTQSEGEIENRKLPFRICSNRLLNIVSFARGPCAHAFSNSIVNVGVLMNFPFVNMYVEL